MQRLIVVALILLLNHMPVAFAAGSLRESSMSPSSHMPARTEARGVRVET